MELKAPVEVADVSAEVALGEGRVASACGAPRRFLGDCKLLQRLHRGPELLRGRSAGTYTPFFLQRQNHGHNKERA
jgi:hypothetical protein